MRILVSYRGIPQSPGWATGDLVVKALRALGHFAVPYARNYKEGTWVEQRDEEWTGQNKWEEVRKQEWDLVLFMECNDDEKQYTEIRQLRARKKVCWLFDTSYYPDECEGLVKWFSFDHIFLANPLTLNSYLCSRGILNASYLPYACDEELHGRDGTAKTQDVVLVGSIRDDRITLATALADRGIYLHLVGGVFREEYIDALASARIVVNQNPDAGRGLLNMRHFEVQAAGSFLVEQWNDLSPNMDAGMSIGGAVSNYETVDDIADLCTDYLACAPDVAEECRPDFLAEHTYQSRCKTILKTVFPHEA